MIHDHLEVLGPEILPGVFAWGTLAADLEFGAGRQVIGRRPQSARYAPVTLSSAATTSSTSKSVMAEKSGSVSRRS
jgi:hypothetical protein